MDSLAAGLGNGAELILARGEEVQNISRTIHQALAFRGFQNWLDHVVGRVSCTATQSIAVHHTVVEDSAIG